MEVSILFLAATAHALSCAEHPTSPLWEAIGTIVEVKPLLTAEELEVLKRPEYRKTDRGFVLDDEAWRARMSGRPGWGATIRVDANLLGAWEGQVVTGTSMSEPVVGQEVYVYTAHGDFLNGETCQVSGWQPVTDRQRERVAPFAAPGTPIPRLTETGSVPSPPPPPAASPPQGQEPRRVR